MNMRLPRLALALPLCLATLTCNLPGLRGDAAPALPPGVRLIESVAKRDGDLLVPYSKYVLDNGLTLVLHRDPSDPIAHVDVTYHVGSAREQIGRSGFAHFFEHMMFQGSQNVDDEEHFKLISEAGGSLNGSTSRDITNYYETVPANQLERVLWLEADRMGFLLQAVTPEKFEIQRDTVKNERGQSYDNRPYGLVGERVSQALYPEGHPYSWLTIGYTEDLDRVNVNDLKQFFLRWYGPNNATLTIGGDFDPAQVLAWVQKYFGSIPRGPDVAEPEIPTVTLPEDRYISLEDDVSLPLVNLTWPTVAGFHPDEAPLDVLSSIIGSGKTSLLYKNLVKEGLAVNAAGSHPCFELACSFSLYALPNPANPRSLGQLEQILRDSLREFEERGVQEDDLDRVKMSILASKIYGLESVAGKVSQLAFYQTLAGNPNYVQDDLERYRQVTREDVVRVYERYLKDRPAVILSVVPRGQLEAVAAPDSFTPPEREIPTYAETTAEDLELRAAQDTFDRSVPPAPGPNPTITLPALWRGTLANGIEVLGAVSDEVPTTSILVLVQAGQRAEPLEKAGLAALTAAMLNESTLKSTSEDLSNRLQLLGSSVSVSGGETDALLEIRSLSENLPQTLQIAREKLGQPAFQESDFTRLRDQTVQGIESARKQPAVVADQVLRRLVYGPGRSASASESGTVETLSRIGLEDVKAFYQERYSAAVTRIIAVSNLPRDELLKELGVFADLPGESVAEPTFTPPEQADPSPIYVVDKPGAAQSELRVARLALPYDATGPYYRSLLMNFALGGAFNSRINLNLREDKGYTYGAQSFFTGDDQVGRYTAQAAVRTDVTAAALSEIYKEIRTYAETGITDAELAFTQSAIGQSDALRYETPTQRLGLLSNILMFDLPDDFVDRQKEILTALSKPEVDALAASSLDLDRMVTVVVGDRVTVLPQLRELGRPIVELNDEGDPVESSSE